MSDMRRKILKNLDSPQWNENVVALAIATKKEKLNKKGIPFNCFVIKRDSNPDKDELRIFINYLKNQIDQQLLSEARMQLAIVDGIHWTACDIQIKNKNIYIFLMPLLSILVYLI